MATTTRLVLSLSALTHLVDARTGPPLSPLGPLHAPSRHTTPRDQDSGPWTSTQCFTDGRMHYTLPSFQTSVDAFCAAADGAVVPDGDQARVEYLYCYGNAMVVSSHDRIPDPGSFG
ncbi:hypothetical protein Tdes44962_MAKER06512 [Teratosphaeria destructans]|uniref:Uncharacterized protein n=1 Tax=Teratosphaeria destructans TaxID=418781 RepID=A0A9W7W7L3_9PEZI|nr:hypothetical protein Tdes44962_MAKER06512 [Teratosphaeria destructans]